MASHKRISTAVLTIIVTSVFLLGTAAPGRAQQTPATDEASLLTNSVGSSAAAFLAITGQPRGTDSADLVPRPTSTSSADDAWHFAVSPYLWFPGTHGTAAGPNGRSLSFRASPGDLLSHFRFGLMGAVEVNRKRFVVTGDMLWVRLRADKAIPLPGLGATSANMKATEFFLTPKIGLRVINQEQIKITALTGMRYWHLGEELNFNPSLLGLNFTGSQDFVDPLVGGRIEAFLSPKVVVNILGDVGGWGTGSELEYQWAATLGYRVNARWALHAGYRYLNVDKHGNRGTIFNVTTAGVITGITLDLK